MPSPWLQDSLPTAFAAKLATRRDEVMRNDIRERAKILMRLGRSEQEAAARLRSNLEWEFDLGSRANVVGEVGALVREVYARRSV